MKPELPETDGALQAADNDALRRKIETLEREVEGLRKHHGTPHIDVPDTRTPQPSRRFLRSLLIVLTAVFALALAAGLLPKLRRQQVLAAESAEAVAARPIVPVATVTRAPGASTITLPGTLQPVTEAPVLARASGYVKRRYVDIGDRVQAGQVLAEIEAPELQQQVREAAAALAQSRSALEQSRANLTQGMANRDLARVSAERYGRLQQRGIVSRQENDTYQAQYKAQDASVDALRKAVAASQSNVAAAEANLARVKEMESYLKVRAPFAGIITLRNIDLGTLVAEGNTMLYRVAQTGTLRAYINAPQVNASALKPGESAELTFSDLPGRVFVGKLTRASGSLDPATRTLLVEVQVANPKGELMPGMYANIALSAAREIPPLLIPSEALIARADGTTVAVVEPGGTVHYRSIRVGRDTGLELEVLDGLEEGMQVIINPNDRVREGVSVETRAFVRPKPAGTTTAPGAGVKKAS
jgi:RND family efflux transporter MFP subunit